MDKERNEKVIKSNMEAKVTICLKDEFKDMAKLADSLKQLFIVAKVVLTDTNEGTEYETGHL